MTVCALNFFLGTLMPTTFLAPWRTIFIILCFLASAAPVPGQEKSHTTKTDPDALLEKARQYVHNCQLPEAERTYLQALQLDEQRLAADNVSTAVLLRWCQCRNELGELQFHLLKVPEAKALMKANIAYLKQVVPLRPKEPELRLQLAKTHHGFHRGYSHVKLHLEAETQEREAIDQLRQLIQEHPQREDYHLQLSQWLTDHASVLLLLGRYPEAEKTYQEAIRLAEKLTQSAPASKMPEYVHNLAVTYNAYAYLVRESGRFAETIDIIRTAIGLLSKLERDYPDRPEYWHPLPTLYHNLAQPLGYARSESEIKIARREASRIEAKLAQIPEASRKWQRDADKVLTSLDTRDIGRLLKQQQEMEIMYKQAEKMAQGHATSAYVQFSAAAAKSIRTVQLLARGRTAECKKEVRESLAIGEKLIAQSPDIPLYRHLQSEWEFSYFVLFFIEGNIPEGEKLLRAWAARHEKFANDYPKVPDFRFRLATKLAEVTIALAEQRRFKEAAGYYKMGQDVMKKLAQDFPTCPTYRRLYAEGFTSHGKFLSLAGMHTEAEAVAREGLQHWPKLIADFPTISEFRHNCALDYRILGQILSIQKKYPQAEEAFREMIRIEQKLVEENPRREQFQVDLARGYEWLAALYEKQERHKVASETYTRAILVWEKALQLNLRQRAWLGELRDIVQKRSIMHFKLGEQAAYESDLKRAKDLGEMLETPAARLVRVEYRVQEGELPRALQDAGDLFENVDLTDGQWYELAVFYTNAATKMTDASQKEALAGRAVASLRNAIEQGYDRTTLSRDIRLQPLAQRDEFRKLCWGK